jgi:hypothetical protein
MLSNFATHLSGLAPTDTTRRYGGCGLALRIRKRELICPAAVRPKPSYARLPAMLDSQRYAHIADLQMNWYVQGDEWLHWLSASLRHSAQHVDVLGHSFNAQRGPFVEITIGALDVGLEVQIVVGIDQSTVAVFIDNRSATTPELRSAVVSAVMDACEQLGRHDGCDHTWNALIGHPSHTAGQARLVHLVKACRLGQLYLRPAEVALLEPVAMRDSLSAVIARLTRPIRVRGVSPGYSWEVAQLHAARELRTVCALLSVAWDCEIALREPAVPTSAGLPLVATPWYNPPPEVETDIHSWPGEPRLLPGWVRSGWDAAHRKDWLRSALDAYLEGVYVESRHPSLAVVAYTASIETIASRVYRITDGGIAEGFRAALRIVLSEAEATLLDTAYGSRSRTVHAGRFHGGETLPGAFRMTFWSEDPVREFRWHTLENLRHAARLLLHRALTDGLPGTRMPLPVPGPAGPH